MKKDTIWTENELKEIKKIILGKRRTGLFFDNDNHLCFEKEKNIFPFAYQDELIYAVNTIFDNVTKEDIDNILLKYSNTEFDINNKLHYGLISSLSKIDLTKDDKYYTQIFVIIKELISQYERIISTVINESFSSIDDIGEVKEKINIIKHGVSTEEKQVNFLMQKIFAQTNGLDNERFFEEIINNCNEKIKDKLFSKAVSYLTTICEKKEKKETIDVVNYKKDLQKKYSKRNLDTRRRFHGGHI